VEAERAFFAAGIFATDLSPHRRLKSAIVAIFSESPISATIVAYSVDEALRSRLSDHLIDALACNL